MSEEKQEKRLPWAIPVAYAVIWFSWLIYCGNRSEDQHDPVYVAIFIISLVGGVIPLGLLAQLSEESW